MYFEIFIVGAYVHILHISERSEPAALQFFPPAGNLSREVYNQRINNSRLVFQGSSPDNPYCAIAEKNLRAPVGNCPSLAALCRGSRANTVIKFVSSCWGGETEHCVARFNSVKTRRIVEEGGRETISPAGFFSSADCRGRLLNSFLELINATLDKNGAEIYREEGRIKTGRVRGAPAPQLALPVYSFSCSVALASRT